MHVFKNRYLILLWLNCLFFGFQGIYAQINAVKIECLNNVTNLSYTPPSGLSISSIKWTFGDGSASISASPKYIYKSTGYFTIKIQAVLSNNTNATDSHVIQIVPLPNAKYLFLPKSDSCSDNNLICYKDQSTPANSGQPIVKRLLIWGDGEYNMSYTPQFGDEMCHKYKTVDKYLIKMEITDVHGCKNSESSYIHIVKQTQADFHVSTQFKDCFTKQICINNISSGPDAKSASYLWTTDNINPDTNNYFSNSKCTDYKVNQSVSTKLIVRDKNGCSDSIMQTYYIYIDSLPTSMYLKDTVICYSNDGLNIASIKSVQYDKIIWKIDNQTVSVVGSTIINFNAKNLSILPGIHQVICNIIRGNCTTTLKRKLVINGPIAGMKILDNNQCFSNRQIVFVDNSRYIDQQDAEYRWTIYDNNADTCTIHRAKGINKYTNCIYALDWYAKHQYKNAQSKNPVKLWVRDPKSGCTDTILDFVNLKVCSPILGFDSVDVCQGDMFTKNPLASDPKYISIDSGKTWKKFPMLIDKTLSGKYDIGFIFQTVLTEWAEHLPNDSIRIRRDTVRFYDTIFKKSYLNVHAYKQDSVSFNFYGTCSPYRLSVHFKKGIFYAGESLNITWNDGTSYSRQFYTNTIIDSVFHVYKGNAFNRLIKVGLGNENNCESATYFAKQTGNLLSNNQTKPYYCKAEKPICFNASVYNLSKKTYWTPNQLDSGVTWKFSDTNKSIQTGSLCYQFTHKGRQYYQMIVKDIAGNCSDTLSDSFFIQDLRADVKGLSKEIYCSELKQFFDSSSILKYKKDSIIEYVWDFGTGNFTNPQKNPFKSLNTSSESIMVTHAIKTLQGCVDTIRFKLKITGSHPYFKIRDTIGCDSLTTMFTNLSKNCKGYIWEFGDKDKTSFATDKKDNVDFSYLKPGRYYISLNGYDSIYNPATKAVYFCNNVFPDPVFDKDSIRSVLVLPRRKTGISSKDSICVGTQLTFKSLSDTFYNIEHWTSGDSSGAYLSTPGKLFSHRYNKTGVYRITLKPTYTIPAYNICTDSAAKTITVLGIKADFTIDFNNKSPIFQFHNTSSPPNALLNWNFGHPSSGNRNFSGENDPTHNYGYDTGSYTICLKAALPLGCIDSVCKNIYNNYLADLLLPNVFTPSNIDDKNDFYDILIEGEDFYRLRIYNRWGVLVYEGNMDADNTQTLNWNGKLMNTGVECPSGTYYYIFDYSLKITPEQHETIEGTITLIR